MDNAKDKWGTWVKGLEVKPFSEIDIKAADAVVITPFKNETVETVLYAV